MAETHLAASTGQMASGTPRNTSPHPDRTAAAVASQGAPV